MDNDYGSFWFWLNAVANCCQIQSNDMLEQIYKQNEEILKLLRKEK